MYRKVTVEGNMQDVESMSLEEMQNFVGGYIEEHGDFIVNEDGLRLNLPRNKLYPQYVGNIIIQI